MAEYEIVIAATGLVTLVIAYSYKIFYNYIVMHEKELKKKVEEEIIENVKEYKKILKDNSAEVMVDNLSDIAYFTKLVDEGKNRFEQKILYSGVAIIIFSFLYVFFSGKPEQLTMMILGILTVVYILHQANMIRMNKTKIERFLNDEKIKDILDDD